MYDGYRYRGREIAPPQKKKIPSPIHDTKKSERSGSNGKKYTFQADQEKIAVGRHP